MNRISQNEWASAKKFVKLSTGINMAYIEMGDPCGEPVILQHGMTDNSRSWSLAAPYFADAGYHVLLPDLRGMGKSDQPDGYYTTFDYAKDLKAFLDAMGIDKAICAGHSLGSYTVQTLMLMFPEKVSKLILVSSALLQGLQNDSLLGAYSKYIESLPEDGHPSDMFMDAWYACSCHEEKYNDLFEVVITNLKQEAQCLSKKAWTNIFLGLVISRIGPLYSMMKTDVPILVLHGDEDTMAKGEFQPELLDTLKVSPENYRNYPEVGHNIQFELPEKCSTDIIGWLKTGKLPE